MKVVFSCDEHLLGAIPSPVPAIKMAPDYFRNVKPQSDSHPGNSTVKRCVPFIEALSFGFIIPMWCDVYVFARNGELKIDFPSGFMQAQTFETHASVQIPKHPLSRRPYGNVPMKWINPWVVETDPGVSCFFTSPLNHMETRFLLLDGVVDTDTYYNNVNLPFFWTGGDGEFFIKKGTPLVQVIPFVREDSTLEIKKTDDARRTGVRAILGTKIKNNYRDELWHGRKLTLDEVSVDRDDYEAHGTEEPEVVETSGVVSRSSTLQERGYVALNGLISKGETDRLTSALREHIENNEASPDPLCPKSKAVHGLPQLDELLERLTPVISEATGKNLVPTYSYARMYVNGETLPKHRDRAACQYSVTLCLGMDSRPWPIFMAPQADASSGTPWIAERGGTEYMGEPSSVDLGVGDAVLYLGMDMVHYREAFEGQWQAQVFLHYVDANGDHADQKYDGRDRLAHHGGGELTVEELAAPKAGSVSSESLLEVQMKSHGGN